MIVRLVASGLLALALALALAANAEELTGRVVGVTDGDTLTVAAARRGLWADANPMPPWEWRHGGKAAARVESAPVPAELAGRCGAKRTPAGK